MENGSNRREPERLEGLDKRAENAARASALPGMTERFGPAGVAAKFRQRKRGVDRQLRAKSAACLLTVNTRQLPQE